jgi:alkylation response protein AidB-like acyl-CoA dehydrogenase
MDLTLSDSERAFRDDVRGWLAENHPGPTPKEEDAAFAFRRDWQRQLNERGWAGLSWPEEYGGAGATVVEQAIFYEEVARAGAPQMANTLALAIGGPTVIAHGTEDQKSRFLAPILSADEIWCQGFSEPQSGSDLASLKTRAVRADGGFRVTGQKVWTTWAHKSKWCMLVARTTQDVPKHRGLTYFLLDMEQDGVEARPLRQITGEADFNELFLDGAFVPEENVVGGVDNGWSVAITTLMHERVGLAFALQVDVHIELRRLRLNAYRGLTGVMKRGAPGPEGSLGKWHWAEVNQSLTELALDILGPEAQLVDHPWTYRFLRSRANSIEGGTTEILKNIVAERVLGLPRG